jgi:hypothetical protein
MLPGNIYISRSDTFASDIIFTHFVELERTNTQILYAKFLRDFPNKLFLYNIFCVRSVRLYTGKCLKAPCMYIVQLKTRCRNGESSRVRTDFYSFIQKICDFTKLTFVFNILLQTVAKIKSATFTLFANATVPRRDVASAPRRAPTPR